MSWLDQWRRNHLMATPFGVFVCSSTLWISQGYSFAEALGSSIIQFGVLIYAVLVSLSEMGGAMFYAIAMARKWRKEQQAKTDRAVAEATTAAIEQAVADERARLVSAATPKEGKLLEHLMQRVDGPSS